MIWCNLVLKLLASIPSTPAYHWGDKRNSGLLQTCFLFATMRECLCRCSRNVAEWKISIELLTLIWIQCQLWKMSQGQVRIKSYLPWRKPLLFWGCLFLEWAFLLWERHVLPPRDGLIWMMQNRVERNSFCSRGKLPNIRTRHQDLWLHFIQSWR